MEEQQILEQVVMAILKEHTQHLMGLPIKNIDKILVHGPQMDIPQELLLHQDVVQLPLLSWQVV